MTRDEFREGVFARDNHTCVNCGQPGQDAHHIMERRLWSDGGYHLDNGATLCGFCHFLAEETNLTPETIREKAGIHTTLLPPHLYTDTQYDKWGNPVLPNGTRLRGELFEDRSLQKVLDSVLHLFVNRVKYPRTYHVPWSGSVFTDDRTLTWKDIAKWHGREVVITEKMDGENTTVYRDYVHARSIEYTSHPSRTFMKSLQAKIGFDVPESFRICGENLWAKHSIGYHNLDAFFLVFSIWDGLTCLSWDETTLWTDLLSLKTVPVLYRGLFNRDAFMLNHSKLCAGNPDHREGYVIRPASSFSLQQFPKDVGKYVRHNHVRTHGHWMRSEYVLNHVGQQ